MTDQEEQYIPLPPDAENRQKLSRSLNSMWPEAVQKAVIEARRKLMALAWEEGYTAGILDAVSADGGSKVEPTLNPYRSDS